MSNKPQTERTRSEVIKGNIGVALLCLVTVGLATFSLSRVVLSRNANLDNNGNWLSTKTLLENGVNGTYAFVDGTQSLAGQALNLGAWCGFQEVIYIDRLELGEVSFDFKLEPLSYVVFLFNRNEEGGSGIRFSISPHFSNTLFTADADMKFLTTKDFALPLLANEWNSCTITFRPDGFSATCNGTRILDESMPMEQEQLIGFRGCLHYSYIDNIEIRQRGPMEGALKPSPTVYESFSQANRSTWENVLWALLGVVLLNLVIIAAVTAVKRDVRGAMLRASTLNMSLCVVGFALFLFIDRIQARRYPNPGVNVAVAMREESFKNELRARAVTQVLNAYPTKQPGTFRILFMGTSQIFGAGSMHQEDAIVDVVQRRLNETAPEGTRVECVNGGLSGLNAESLRFIFRDSWIKLEPDLVVVNLSNNDIDHDSFATHLDGLVKYTKEKNIPIILIAEPNTIEQEGDFLPTNHRIMRDVAQRNNVPLVEMHRYLLTKSDLGFLWWDHVHLSSLGQRLFAERLLEELHKHNLVGDAPRNEEQ